jgi:holo-[acyl-carrier protein] synthase
VNEVPEVAEQYLPASSHVLAVGIDLASIPEVRLATEDFGQRYLRRVFTPAELSYCLASGNPVAQLAVMWAAKEATVKAFGMVEAEAPWHSIEVWRRPNGPCQIRLSGAVAQAAEERGIKHLVVSLSCGGDLATAIVVATGPL